ncbi:hypothetical protein [Burkholderia cepacia]|uniref:hypothetical protein n=1 Tax=Burkholderia cepacia TaxID=292 RepID=UPI000A9A9B3D|nr:hypothetical protein [Burkholderia cepacia]
MDKDQFNIIVGLVSGLQLSIIHLANTVAEKTNTPREAIAQSFLATAEALPHDTRNHELISLVVKRIAEGIAQAELKPGLSLEIEKILH